MKNALRINFKYIRHNNEYMVQWFKGVKSEVHYFELKEDALEYIKEIKSK